MILRHGGHAPRVAPTAWVAPNAVLCGDVEVGPDCQIGYGAVLVAEGGSIILGRQVIVRDHAALRASARHALTIGSYVLIGPGSCLFGCSIDDEVFVATRATVFYGARLGKGSEVRVNGVVHVHSKLPAGATVPIGWVAVGDPARILPPAAHEEIWHLQEPLNFPRVAYGLERRPDGAIDMKELTRRLAEASAAHRSDHEI
jgi:carbonic anhydrase/acetyltransferase-like protein (isoleucine patch superfamily)